MSIVTKGLLILAAMLILTDLRMKYDDIDPSIACPTGNCNDVGTSSGTKHVRNALFGTTRCTGPRIGCDYRYVRDV